MFSLDVAFAPEDFLFPTETDRTVDSLVVSLPVPASYVKFASCICRSTACASALRLAGSRFESWSGAVIFEDGNPPSMM